MPDDPLETSQSTVTVTRGKKCVCEFCGCQLTPEGEIIKMGTNARDFRKHEETIEKFKEQVASLTAQIADLQKKITELESERHAPTPTGHRPGLKVQ